MASKPYTADRPAERNVIRRVASRLWRAVKQAVIQFPVVGYCALIAAGIAVVLLLLGPVTVWLGGTTVAELTGKDHADAIDATRRTLFQAVAGLLALGALVFTARTYLLSREGQVTDRYTKAIGQLGATTVAERAGGVFALERIMHDSPRDHWAVVQVIAVFIRSWSTAAPDTTRRSEHEGPDADVKAALTVLGRRPQRMGDEPDRLRLSDADLRRTVLRDGRLDRAALRGAHLDKVHWERVSLVNARMRRAHMHDADLAGANMRGAGLYAADLTDADLTGADLSGADLSGADLSGADLSGADLTKADLRGTHLAGAQGTAGLSAAQLAEAHCRPETNECPETRHQRPSYNSREDPVKRTQG